MCHTLFIYPPPLCLASDCLCPLQSTILPFQGRAKPGPRRVVKQFKRILTESHPVFLQQSRHPPLNLTTSSPHHHINDGTLANFPSTFPRNVRQLPVRLPHFLISPPTRPRKTSFYLQLPSLMILSPYQPNHTLPHHPSRDAATLRESPPFARHHTYHTTACPSHCTPVVTPDVYPTPETS